MAKKQTTAKFVRFQAEIMWAYLNKVNEMSTKYQFDACLLNPKTVAALEAIGVEVKVSEKHPEKGQFITCKSARPITAQDEDGDRIDGSIVGNGTKATLTVGTYDWNFKGKKGTSPSIKKFVVNELVEYTGEEPDEDEIEDTL